MERDQLDDTRTEKIREIGTFSVHRNGFIICDCGAVVLPEQIREHPKSITCLKLLDAKPVISKPAVVNSLMKALAPPLLRGDHVTNLLEGMTPLPNQIPPIFPWLQPPAAGFQCVICRKACSTTIDSLRKHEPCGTRNAAEPALIQRFGRTIAARMSYFRVYTAPAISNALNSTIPATPQPSEFQPKTPLQIPDEDEDQLSPRQWRGYSYINKSRKQVMSPASSPLPPSEYPHMNTGIDDFNGFDGDMAQPYGDHQPNPESEGNPFLFGSSPPHNPAILDLVLSLLLSFSYTDCGF